jgi:hypothetical protein
VVVVMAEPHLAISGVVTRTEIWLLAVFTEGVLALLGGLSGWVREWVGSRGVRDLSPDGGTGTPVSVDSTLRSKDSTLRSTGVTWVTALGICLLAIYSAGWLFTRT